MVPKAAQAEVRAETEAPAGDGGASGTGGASGDGGASGNGGAATGGAAGTTSGDGGSAGAAGTVQGGSGGTDTNPPPKCKVSDSNDPCDVCSSSKCCAAQAACLADSACKSADSKRRDCLDSHAASQCCKDFAAKGSLEQSWQQCVVSSCKTACEI